ncbi:unnamed protein product [Timema podura]|uniref:DNA polymerase alpha subunit B n=1 Tax=Timema podura TaxID=61482 RepID=A0ABN7PFH8_TIMPD|nr:unnamed protein product [Timema podura]
MLVVGRVCCDANGHLNVNSVLLEGTRMISGGMSVYMDLHQLPQYALFPGQVIAAEVLNPTGQRLMANKLYTDASLPSPERLPHISSQDDWKLMADGEVWRDRQEWKRMWTGNAWLMEKFGEIGRNGRGCGLETHGRWRSLERSAGMEEHVPDDLQPRRKLIPMLKGSSSPTEHSHFNMETEGPLHVLVAAGPYTQTDTLTYEPLEDILQHVKVNKPHVLILIGPFVDSTHPHIVDGSFAETFESFFEKIIDGIMNTLKE